MIRGRLAPGLILLVATLHVLRAIAEGPRWTVDDAFIVARYAENLAHHGRLAWNLDGPPVEGFTGLALPLVMAAAVGVRLSPIDVATAIGVASLFVGAALVYACHRPLGLPRVAGAIAGATYLAAAEQLTHALSGLETELFIALTVATAWAALRAVGAPGHALPVIGAACALVRPEGAAVGAAFLAAVMMADRPHLRAWLRVTAVGFVAPVAAVQIFRLAYFGAWLPNTYHAKHLPDGVSPVFAESLWQRGHDYLLPAVIALGAVGLIAWLAEARVPPSANRRAAGVLLLGCTLSTVALGGAYLKSRLVMNYSSRFAFHLFGLMALLVLLCAGEAWRRAAELVRRRPALGGLTAALALSALGLGALRGALRAGDEAEFRRGYRRTLETQHLAIARWIGERFGAGAKVACYPDAGVIPYVTRLRAIDFGKLSDAYLAREARTDQDVVEYFFRVEPDVLVLTHLGGLTQAWDPAADRLLADPRFSRYERVSFHEQNGIGPAVYVRR